MSTLALVAAAAVCGTVHVMPPGPAPERMPVLDDAPRGDDSKTPRDLFGAPNVATSANFALRWGDLVEVNEGKALDLLADLERSWQVQMEEMDHPAPDGTDAFLFNVYLGDTGAGTPQTYDVNYFSYDDEGWPMIVLHPGNLDEPDSAAITIAHELYHAVQAATGNYISYDEDSAQSWYWEASASWVMGEVFPDNPSQAGLLFGYAFAPHLSVEHFQYATAEGGIETLHQYGAFIFLRYLTEHVADPTLVRDSWLQGSPWAVPTEVLDDLLRERDPERGVDDVFPSFAAANATWDYERGELYAGWLDALADWYPGDDQRVAAEVSADGTAGWVDAPAGTAPVSLAYNVVEVPDLEPGEWVIGVERAATGTQSTDSRLQAVLVRDSGAGPQYSTLDLEDHAAEVIVQVIDGEELHIVASTLSSDGPRTERFEWSYRVEPVVQPDPDPDPDPDPGQLLTGTGCTCETAPSPRPSWLLLLPGLALLRRRRG